MTTFIESISTAILLILLILLFSHMMNGTTSAWISSKIKAAPA